MHHLFVALVQLMEVIVLVLGVAFVLKEFWILNLNLNRLQALKKDRMVKGHGDFQSYIGPMRKLQELVTPALAIKQLRL